MMRQLDHGQLVEVRTTSILGGRLAVVIDTAEMVFFGVDLLDDAYMYSIGVLCLLEDVLDSLGAPFITIMYNTNKDLSERIHPAVRDRGYGS